MLLRPRNIFNYSTALWMQPCHCLKLLKAAALTQRYMAILTIRLPCHRIASFSGIIGLKLSLCDFFLARCVVSSYSTR